MRESAGVRHASRARSTDDELKNRLEKSESEVGAIG